MSSSHFAVGSGAGLAGAYAGGIPECVRATCEVHTKDSVFASNLRGRVNDVQQLHRTALSLRHISVRGIPNELVFCPLSQRIVKFSLVASSVHVTLSSFDEEGSVVWSSTSQSQQLFAGGEFLQISHCDAWEDDQFLVVARTAKILVAWIVADAEDQVTWKQVMCHKYKVQLQCFALPDMGHLIAVLTRQGVIDIWDLQRSTTKPVKSICLKPVPFSKTFTSELETNSNTSKCDNYITNNMILDALTKGEKLITGEIWLSLCWSGTRELLLCGKKIWTFDLDKGLLVTRFPGRVGPELMAHTDHHVEDFGFTCISCHPYKPVYVFAVSALHHEIMVFDLRQRPLVPIAHLPTPDTYGIASCHTSAKWFTSADIQSFESILNPQWTHNSNTAFTAYGACAFILPPFQENVKSLQLHSHVYIVPPLEVPRAGIVASPVSSPPTNLEESPDEPFDLMNLTFGDAPLEGESQSQQSEEVAVGITEVTPFDFNVNAYSQWDSLCTGCYPFPGNLEFHAIIRKLLLLKSIMLTITQTMCTTNLQPSQPSVKYKSSLKAITKLLDSAPAAAPDCSKPDRLYGNLSALDAGALQLQCESWNQPNLVPSPLTMPRPRCLCGLIEKRPGSYTLSHTYHANTEIDLIGPINASVALTFANRHSVEEAALQVKCTPRKSMNPEEVSSLVEDLSACSCDPNYCLGDQMAIPTVQTETGEDPKIKMQVTGLGLPINKHLVNALLEAWPAPQKRLNDVPTLPLVIANVSKASETQKQSRMAGEEALQSLLGLSQEAGGNNWFDNFGEGGGGGDDEEEA